MKLNAPNLQNDVVRLAPIEHSHREDLREAGSSQAMWDWMPVIATGTNFDAYFDYVLGRHERGETVGFAIFRQSDGGFAGVGGYCDIQRTHRRLRIDYLWVRDEMRGTAIGLATQYALIERALQARMRRIEFMISEENIPALKALERIGAVREGLFRNYQRLANGQWANMVALSLLETEAHVALRLLKDRITAHQQTITQAAQAEQT